VTEKIFNHHLSGNIRIIHHKFREEIHYPAIPANLSFIHQHPQSQGSKQLAVGGNAEQALSIYRGWLTQLFNSIAFGQQHLSIFNNGQTNTRYFKSLHDFHHQLIQTGWQRSLFHIRSTSLRPGLELKGAG